MSKTIIAFGEILWDLLPDGPVLGGAPFNFVCRAAGLGYDVAMISAVGNDARGREALAEVKRLGLSTRFVQSVPGYPTGTVQIAFDENGQPEYEITQDVAYDHVAFTPEIEMLARSAACISFGTLAQRAGASRETLARILDLAQSAGSPILLLDVNLRKGCWDLDTIKSSLQRANVVKLNEEEAHQLARELSIVDETLPAIAARLVADWSLLHCVVTLGERGVLCVSQDGTNAYDPGYAVHVVDPCGAGDALSAGFIHAILQGHSAGHGCRLGNILGAMVARQRGATQPIPLTEVEHFATSAVDRCYEPSLVPLIPSEAYN